MAAPRILPLGFIDRTTNDGAIIMLTRPSDSHDLRTETPVTLRSRSTGQTPATARVRGIITSVGYVTATFQVVEINTTSRLARRRASTAQRNSRLPSPGRQLPARPSQNAKQGASRQPQQTSRPVPRNREATTPQGRHPTVNRPGTAPPPTHSHPQSYTDILTNIPHSDKLY